MTLDIEDGAADGPEVDAEIRDWLFIGAVLALAALAVVTGVVIRGGSLLVGIVGLIGVLIGIGILIAGRLIERGLVEMV
jgi:hypothetical protein